MESSRTKIKSRFDKKYIVKKNGCWVWAACRNQYGRFSIFGRTEYAHRVAWYLRYDRWPSRFICHSCDNPDCVNPEHLFEGTNTDNLRDAAIKGRMPGKPRVLADRGEVRQAYAVGHSQRTVAEWFNISQTTVSEIVRFKHEPKEPR